MMVHRRNWIKHMVQISRHIIKIIYRHLWLYEMLISLLILLIFRCWNILLNRTSKQVLILLLDWSSSNWRYIKCIIWCRKHVFGTQWWWKITIWWIVGIMKSGIITIITILVIISKIIISPVLRIRAIAIISRPVVPPIPTIMISIARKITISILAKSGPILTN